MFDANWENKFLERVRQASYEETMQAYQDISNLALPEKEWLMTKEVAAEYEVSDVTLWRMRTKLLTLRKGKDWKYTPHGIAYHRAACNEKLVRRSLGKDERH